VTANELQALCEEGQQRLMRMEYLTAEAVLEQAEAAALAAEDFDTLGRLYFPLQEARRQRRQVCGEGAVRLDLWARGPDDALDAEQIIADHPHGQLLVAGWASIEPAVRLRELARQRQLYVETFLGAVYPATADGSHRVIAIIPTADVALPPADAVIGGGMEALIRRLPPFSIVLAEGELPSGARRGSADTFALTMGLWERLHLPFLIFERRGEGCGPAVEDRGVPADDPRRLLLREGAPVAGPDGAGACPQGGA
jgi:hypothetical protein